ncbi:ribosomal-processing cysteine protease Prp [Serpentinicella sp. ANB-PHB4]|uniref:ribosomal-processing cysteine protease Prp n=1 Tax=Serpentinicella sp. ANB-PHB4 TaxID=3074076 RepID=UPI002857C1A5|nr:ribosomal-processing cysteine protease Prp [Serpentinicella sp. ANB-PHB4]MDR5657900.1 ribosomal-processing cysteine protease Prp [Serpentinicella sp. ANB-PHB4]
MIKIEIFRNKQKEVNKYVVSGHAQAAEYGQDIVCSAVSVLSQTTLLGLYEVAEIKVDYEIQDGYLRCSVPESISSEARKKANLLIDTMIIGMRNISESYSKYIDFHDKEV